MLLGLSTGCSRFPQNFPLISQKVAKKSLKKSQKLLFVTKVAQKNQEHFKLLSSFIWSDAKICKLYNKCRISKNYCAFFLCGVTRHSC